MASAAILGLKVPKGVAAVPPVDLLVRIRAVDVREARVFGWGGSGGEAAAETYVVGETAHRFEARRRRVLRWGLRCWLWVGR